MSPDDLYRSLDRVTRDDRTVLTVGYFDGVHLGHRSVLERVRNEAERLGARSLVVTFDRPPKSVLLGTSVPLLTTLEEKSRLIQGLGLSGLVVIPFDHEFAELEASTFVESILVDRIGLCKIVLGYDHHFGRGGSGDINTMRALGERHGFEVEIVTAQSQNGIAYSSTGIREMLVDKGRVADAAVQLGRYYSFRGEVVHGDGRGRTIGFPTANLRLIESVKAVPAVGVYAVFVSTEEGHVWRQGVMNIGYRPTVTEGVQLVAEVHLLEFDGDLYGQNLEVAFVRRLRPEQRFDSLETLVSQIGKDRQDCISILNSVSFPD